VVLVDTDVLIWLTRGHAGAAARLRQAGQHRVSAVTYMELAQGCRNKLELEQIGKALNDGGMPIVLVTEIICERAMRLIDSHALGDGLQLGDALIAATALELGWSLLTANVKHFAPIDGLTLERFDPAQGVA
jgi:predicted nucleic acid-binding protein